jgi:hypothetical protein
MLADSNPNPNPGPWADRLLAVMEKWADATSSTRHTLETVGSYLRLVTKHEESTKADVTEFKGALQKFTSYQGSWGRINWLLDQFEKRPKAVWSMLAAMACTVTLMVALGVVDVSLLLGKLLKWLGQMAGS